MFSLRTLSRDNSDQDGPDPKDITNQGPPPPKPPAPPSKPSTEVPPYQS